MELTIPYARISYPAVILLIAGFLFSPLQAQHYRLTKENSSLRIKYHNHSKPFQVFAGAEKPGANTPSMLGTYTSDGDTLEFTPVVAFRQGKTYTVVGENEHIFAFTVPTIDHFPAARVMAVYPTADTLPANQLKMYLHFATPMREHVAYRHLILTNEQGDTLPRPFLELEPELWDTTGQRLTVWFDPGRVKRALGPNELAGTPLKAGHAYTLTISASWTDKNGQPMESTFSKHFHVSTADRAKPHVKSWQLSPPHTGTRDSLHINFGESLDHALAMNAITILSPQQTVIKGKITLSQAESRWSFQPDQSWQAGNYQIRIASRLEDLAGNNLNRPFDKDLEKEGFSSEEKDFYYIKFEVLP